MPTAEALRKPFYRLRFLAAAMLAGACGTLVPPPGGGHAWVPSPNYGERRPNFVILHQTTKENVADALRTLTNPLKAVSAHYLVGKDGSITQLVDEANRAWHAGDSSWGWLTDINSASIGIELDNKDDRPFTEPQIRALLGLLADIKTRHRIPAANFLAHADVAPGRKVDPNRLFPWRRLAAQGYGLWCDEEELTPPPPAFDALLALQAFGYDTRDAGRAVLAFRRHFAGMEDGGGLDDADRARLFCLLRKKAAMKAFGDNAGESGMGPADRPQTR